MTEVKVDFDPVTDCAYIELTHIPPAGVARTFASHNSVNLDFDAAGRLVGIEVLSASKHLPQPFLQSAKLTKIPPK